METLPTLGIRRTVQTDELNWSTMEPKTKILICGDVEGKFNALFSKIEMIQKKSGAFDLALCVGNFFGVNNKEIECYKSGMKKVPVDTYILGPNKEEHLACYPDEGSELCPGIFYLGKRGLYTSTGGIKIAYISGLASKGNIKPFNYSSEDAIALRDACLKGNANFKGIDILLTAQWPSSVINNTNIDITEPSQQAAWLAAQLRPRYHVCGLEGVHYERPPYRNYTNGSEDIVTRFIALARVANPKKEKWIYAVNLTPLEKMKTSELFQKTTDETGFPYDIAELDALVHNKKRKSESGQQFFFDMNAPEDARNKKKAKKQRVEMDQSKCWFCLASPSVEKHLVITVGNNIYIALAKGGLVDEHLLICPIEHHRCSIDLPYDVLDEIEKYKEAIRSFYARNDQVAVFYERNYKTSHMQVHAVPIPKGADKELADIFKEESGGCNMELQELELQNRLDQVLQKNVPYFTVQMPNGNVLYAKIQAAKGFPINFARDVLVTGPVLDMENRAEWKDCILGRDDEERLVARIRTDFEPFDVTDD